MSTSRKTTRAVKPVALNEAPIATPAVVAPAAATVLPADTVSSLQKRQQTGKAVGTNISPARIRRHIDKLNLNAVVDKMINDIKEPLNAFRAAKHALETGKITTQTDDGKKSTPVERDITQEERTAFQATVAKYAESVQALEDQLYALSTTRTRFSNEASIALAIVCEEFIEQLSEHAIKTTIAHKKKIMQVNHLHEAGVEKLPLYALFKNLPTFAETRKSITEAAEKAASEAAIAAALARAEKDFKKKYGVKVPKKKKADTPAEAVPAEVVAEVPAEAVPAEVAVVEDDDDQNDSKTSFRFYVGQVCKEVVKKDASYNSVRVSTEIRAYLSDLLVEFIQRMSPLVWLTATSMKNKTVNEVAILHAVKTILVDGHTINDNIVYKSELVCDPLHVKAETLKKEEARKAGLKYKIDYEKMPKVNGIVAVRTISFEGSGYSELESKVLEKLAVYEAATCKADLE